MSYLVDTNVLSELALIYGLALVTRNVRDFQYQGLVVIDPWTS